MTDRHRFGITGSTSRMYAGLCAVLLSLLLIGTPHAADVTELPGLSREPLRLVVSGPDGSKTKTLEALVVRPDGPGLYPLVLMTHGLPRNSTAIASLRPQSLSGPAIVFAQHGYAVAIVMRSGYAARSAPFVETLGPCEMRTYVPVTNAAAAVVLAALTRLREEPWADPVRVVLIGQSMGGFAAVAASARNPPGVIGTISFAGAVGSPRPDFVCQPERLVDASRTFGLTAHVPGLWIFAANDHFFGPDLARAMFNAYTEHGAPASLFQSPPFGRDGHGLFWAPDGTAWWPEVATFLKSLRLPTDLLVPLAAPAHLPEPPSLDEAGHAAFATYLPSRNYEKAFATDGHGHFGVASGARTKTDAESAALQDCEKLNRPCSLYAVGNTLASGDSSGEQKSR